MKPYPFLKTYTGENLRHVAMPLGGIGTGTVSLGGRGDLRDWEIMNSPAKTFTPTFPQLKNLGPFFALSTRCGGKKVARLLEGPLDQSVLDPEGNRATNTHFPRFRQATFRTAYPLAELELCDPSVPLRVTLQAMNPMVPGDSGASSLPVAFFTWHLHNPGTEPVEASVCATMVNHIGVDGRDQKRAWGSRTQYQGWKENRNQYREEGGLRGLFFDSLGVDPKSEAWGTMALTTWGAGDGGHRTAWAELSWGDSILDFWDEFSETGLLTQRDGKEIFGLLASLNTTVAVPPGETRAIPFALTWHFPNRKAWDPRRGNPDTGTDFSREDTVGNFYTTRFPDAWHAAREIKPQLASLEARTVDYVTCLVNSPVPAAIKEAALFNASTLRTQTCFQTPDGHFFGWEGIHDFEGSCFGNCTHVWNYEQTTGFLFGDLARSMRWVEFKHNTDSEGSMRFRTKLPLAQNEGPEGRLAAADGQMGTLLKLYREWVLSGDRDFLETIWPSAKKALSFAWVPGGWDSDRDGVMEGCQHNTMDVEYYGPNPQMQTWYLGALKAAAAMAETVGDGLFAADCRMLFDRGSAWTDAHLFNGEYYEQQVGNIAPCHPNLRSSMGSALKDEPDLQLGRGCLIDQLAGQAFASLFGLGYLLKPEHVRATLKSILKYNRQRDFHHLFNPMRQYVLPDEPAVLMATWPRGDRPKRPFPYHSEVMTGFEHLLATHLILEGMADEGEQVTADIRSRHDGYRRNPFDEAECGHHYARAMAAWGSYVACTGFRYDAQTETLHLTSRKTPTFFSWGGGWGTFGEGPDGGVFIDLHQGHLGVKEVYSTGKKTPFRTENKAF